MKRIKKSEHRDKKQISFRVNASELKQIQDYVKRNNIVRIGAHMRDIVMNYITKSKS